MAKNFEISCPCCETTIVVDRVSGEILLHKPKEKKSGWLPWFGKKSK